MWSTICTRVALLVTAQIRESFVAINQVAEATRGPQPTFTTSSSLDEKIPASPTKSEKIPPASSTASTNVRKRAAAGVTSS